MVKIVVAAVALFLLVCAPGSAQYKRKEKEDPTRSVQGNVTGANDVGVKGAIVQLKNTKTLQIRSFITQENGAYYFHELNRDQEYELTAEDQKTGMASPTKKLSSFDTQRLATINLRLAPKNDNKNEKK